MTLRQLIDYLEQLNPDYVCPMGFSSPHSYRGSYYELAFEPCANMRIGDMLALAKSCVGKTFEGYKGGDFTMHDYSIVYIANYGEYTSSPDTGGICVMLLDYMTGRYAYAQGV